MNYEFHPEARNEFDDTTHWYEDRSTQAGDRFVSAVRNAVAAILSEPERYQLLGGGIRVFRLNKFPFRLYYHFDIERQTVFFYAVMHEKRHPNYWRHRLADS